jgi:hypothetical protein
MNDDEIEHDLAVLFVGVWQAFTEGMGIDQADLETMLEATGLVEWRAATAVEAAAAEADLEAGDSILALTDAGKRVRDAGRA